MSDPVKISGNLTLSALQKKLRNIEGFLTEVKELKNDSTDTIALIDDVGAAPTKLRLALDPAGTLQPQPTEKLVCRGEVMVQTFKQKVAAFRPKS